MVGSKLFFALPDPVFIVNQTAPTSTMFGLSHPIVNKIITELSAISEFVLPIKKIQEVEADEPDNRVLECADKASADYIVSGDVHLLEKKKFGSIQLVNPQQFLLLYKK
jgi:predicted nucleic acid-binding protein